MSDRVAKDVVVVSDDSDNAVDALAAVALVAIFVATCVFWVASQ
ncbi:hypothetical protein ACNKU7_14655 [Microbulbifer sp. SA54]